MPASQSDRWSKRTVRRGRWRSAKGPLLAAQLLVAECASISAKRVRWDELLKEEALLAARLLQGAEIELLPMQSLFEATTRMSIEFDHAAYDCVYVALAIDNKC
jgi:predicted nucleic acid-binding protein